jgi:hypothetical protein
MEEDSEFEIPSEITEENVLAAISMMYSDSKPKNIKKLDIYLRTFQKSMQAWEITLNLLTRQDLKEAVNPLFK